MRWKATEGEVTKEEGAGADMRLLCTSESAVGEDGVGGVEGVGDAGVLLRKSARLSDMVKVVFLERTAPCRVGAGESVTASPPSLTSASCVLSCWLLSSASVLKRTALGVDLGVRVGAGDPESGMSSDKADDTDITRRHCPFCRAALCRVCKNNARTNSMSEGKPGSCIKNCE